MDEKERDEISQYRMIARSMGDTALDAMKRGDIGLARMVARQAAQHARIVLQLETGEKQIGPEEEKSDPETKVSGDSLAV